MRKNVSISEEQINDLVKQFYQYFKTGYEFEDFLKFYLEKIGLDEILVTQRSSDGGIDLKAVRRGVGDFSEVDSVQYCIQAKRYKPDNRIQIRQLRELRGVMPSGSKGMFITTADFPKNAEKFAMEDDPSRPIILVNGKKLIESCVDMEIGFTYTPVFSEVAMDFLMRKELRLTTSTMQYENIGSESPAISVNKDVTTNDIRARILRIPKDIINKIPNEQRTIDVQIEGLGKKTLKIDKSRTYLAGITDVYKSKNLIDEDGAYNPRTVSWNYYSDGKIVVIFVDNR
ncbi:MAG: restriction endonuclease [Thermoguttaceae bacterium]|nr:restriction endonuclease [Thermoguttaceae bacterium]